MSKDIINYGPQKTIRKIKAFHKLFATSILIGLGAGTIIFYFRMKKDFPMYEVWDYISFPIEKFSADVFKESDSITFVNTMAQLLSSNYEKVRLSFAMGCLAFCLFFLVSLYYLSKIGRDEKEDSHLRGGKLSTPKELNRQMKRSSKGVNNSTLEFGKNPIKVPLEYSFRSFSIIGRPGTGKSNLLRVFMAQERNRPVKYFIIDEEGSFWRRFGDPKKDKILSVRHKESELWNPKCEDISLFEMAQFFVPDNVTGSNFFPEAAQKILEILLDLSQDLSDLRNYMAMNNEEILNVIQDNGYGVEDIIGSGGSGQATGVIGNMKLKFGFLNDIGYWPRIANKTEPFSIMKWAQDTDDDSWVFIVARKDEMKELSPIISAWFNLAVYGLFKRDESKCYAGEYPAIRIITDELKNLQRLQMLPQAGEELRKYWGSVVACYQNDAQIEKIYGQQIAQNLRDVLQNKIVYSIGDPSAQENLSKYFGEQEIERVSDSISYGRQGSDAHTESSRIENRRLVLPTEFGNLIDGECYVKIASFDPVRSFVPYQEFSNINPPLKWEKPPRRARTVKESVDGVKESKDDVATNKESSSIKSPPKKQGRMEKELESFSFESLQEDERKGGEIEDKF